MWSKDDGGRMNHSGISTIMVIDDEDIVLSLLQRSFEKAGYSVITAREGSEAIRLYQKQYSEIAGIVLDLSMPDMSGQATYDALKEISPEVRIVLSSGFSREEAISRFGERDVAGFIQKPFRPVEIIEKIRSVFELPSC